MNTADTRDATGILDENDASIDQLQPNLTGLNTSGRSNGQARLEQRHRNERRTLSGKSLNFGAGPTRLKNVWC